MSTTKINNYQVMEKIASLKNDINKEMLNIGDSQNNVFKHLKRKSLESKLSRLEKINSILKIEKYKVVFIGSVGAGKTTAICHLFNLIGIFDGEQKSGKTSVIIKNANESLLPAKAGRTTISEVIIKPGDRTYIQVDPHPREVVENYINEFCETLYKSTSEGDLILEAELERAIRSFTNLNKIKEKDKDGKEKSVDLAKEEASKLSVEKLKELAIKNANLDARFYTKEDSILVCPPDKDEKIWLKEICENINYGKEKTFSIPKKTYVFVSQKILGDSKLFLFDSVIDTKGIGENPIRPDLRDYIESEDAICLFTTGYNDAPEASIRELLKYFLSQRSKNFEKRFVIFVMPRKGEPEDENDGDGNWDVGVSIKKDVILNALRSINIDFIPDNIVFYDALRFYDQKKRLMSDYTENHVQNDKDEVILWLDYIVEQRKEALIKEIKEIEDQFLLIVSGQAVTDDDIREINITIDEIKQLSELSSKIPSFVYEEFINKYIEYYSSHYPAWNTKDAIHRRLGIYGERNFDTYYDAKVVSEGTDEDEMLKKFTKEIKEKVIEIIDKLGNTHPDLKSLTPEIIKRFEIAYDEFVSRVGSTVQEYLEKQNKNVVFWKNMIDRRGKGKGYNEDVCTMLRRNLDEINTGIPGSTVSANRVLQEFAEKFWKEAIQKVLNFFV